MSSSVYPFGCYLDCPSLKHELSFYFSIYIASRVVASITDIVPQPITVNASLKQKKKKNHHNWIFICL